MIKPVEVAEVLIDITPIRSEMTACFAVIGGYEKAFLSIPKPTPFTPLSYGMRSLSRYRHIRAALASLPVSLSPSSCETACVKSFPLVANLRTDPRPPAPPIVPIFSQKDLSPPLENQ